MEQILKEVRRHKWVCLLSYMEFDHASSFYHYLHRKRLIRYVKLSQKCNYILDSVSMIMLVLLFGFVFCFAEVDKKKNIVAYHLLNLSLGTLFQNGWSCS